LEREAKKKELAQTLRRESRKILHELLKEWSGER
jgi:hypothetical protein